MNDNPLPSWADGAAKSAILDFVTRVTKEGGPSYVRPAERIATFDNDGTLWCEQPFQVQLYFVRDRLDALAEADSGLKERDPFKAISTAICRRSRNLAKEDFSKSPLLSIRHEQKMSFGHMRAVGSPPASIQNSASLSRDYATRLRSNCSRICAQTASRPSSCRAEASI